MDRARGTLARLNRMNRTGVFLGTVALVLTGLLLPGATGAVLLLALAAGLVALLRLTWPYHDARTRVVRLTVLMLLVLVALAKLVG